MPSPSAIKQRLDRLLIEKGLAPTLEKAQALILAGQIEVNGQKADKPGTMLGHGVSVLVKGTACPLSAVVA